MDLDGTLIQTSKSSSNIKLKIQKYVMAPDKVRWLDNFIKMSLTGKLFKDKELINEAGGFIERAWMQEFPLAMDTNCPGRFLDHYAASEHEAVRLLFARFFRTDGNNKIVHGDMVAPDRRKPAPDLVLEACDSIKVKPKDAVGFEDSLEGIDALVSAGVANVVAVNSQDLTPYEQVEIDKLCRFSNILKIKSFDEVQFQN